jgi:hypothetical protein
MIGPDRLELAEAAPGGRIGGGQMNVGTIILAAEFEIFVNVVENAVLGHVGVG